MLFNLGNWGMAAEDGPWLGDLANDLAATLAGPARRVPEVPHASVRDVRSRCKGGLDILGLLREPGVVLLTVLCMMCAAMAGGADGHDEARIVGAAV